MRVAAQGKHVCDQTAQAVALRTMQCSNGDFDDCFSPDYPESVTVYTADDGDSTTAVVFQLTDWTSLEFFALQASFMQVDPSL